MNRRGTFVHLFVAVSLLSWPAISAATPSSTRPTTTPDDGSSEVTADVVYEASLKWLSDGRQVDAERVLGESLKTFKDDARLWFFAAASVRSRFDVKRSAPLFAHAARLDPDGVYGRAAGLVLKLDGKREVPKTFAALEKLVAERPEDPLLLWTAGVQCRALNRNAKGIEYFGRLLKHLDPGPGIVHQTYGNLLDEVGRSADALPHRELAVKLQPAPWSYQGMANTLTRLGQWADADAAYEKCTGMSPRYETYWVNWAWSMERRGDDAGVLEKCARGLEVAPRSATLWRLRADAERRQERFKEALVSYEQSLAINPRMTRTLRGAAAVLRKLGDTARADEMDRRLAALTGEDDGPATRPAEAE